MLKSASKSLMPWFPPRQLGYAVLVNVGMRNLESRLKNGYVAIVMESPTLMGKDTRRMGFVVGVTRGVGALGIPLGWAQS